MREQYYDIPLEPQVFPEFGPKRCLYCGAGIQPPMIKYCTMLHGELYRMATRTYHRVYWNEFRKTILKRDGYKCKDCGSTDRRILAVHHIVPVSKGGETFDPENCMTLCEDCHVPRYHRKRYQEPRQGQSNLNRKPYQEHWTWTRDI